jgi:hypothetical protein
MERKLRKCSQCGRTGHNYRTCNNVTTVSDRSDVRVKLFGVYLTNGGDAPVKNDNLRLNEAAHVKNKGMCIGFFLT